MIDFIDPILTAAGLPHCYGFVSGTLPDLPYVAYDFPQTQIRAPDDISCPTRVYDVTVGLELLTVGKDFATETLLDSIVPASEIKKEERYLSDANLYSVTYTFTVTRREIFSF